MGLRQRVAHDLEGDAGDLDVHLQRGDPALGAGDLEVHVAEVVLDAGDVGQDDVVVALLDQAHRDARDRAPSGTPASISESEEPQTHAIEEEPLDSRMSETTRTCRGTPPRRDHRHERPLGERAVADVAALGAAEAPGLPDRERREVVVVEVALLRLEPERVQPHLLLQRAERDDAERLRLAAREQRRAVRARVTPTSIEMSRISFGARPSGRFLCTAIRSRMIAFSSLSKARWDAARCPWHKRPRCHRAPELAR